MRWWEYLILGYCLLALPAVIGGILYTLCKPRQFESCVLKPRGFHRERRHKKQRNKPTPNVTTHKKQTNRSQNTP